MLRLIRNDKPLVGYLGISQQLSLLPLKGANFRMADDSLGGSVGRELMVRLWANPSAAFHILAAFSGKAVGCMLQKGTPVCPAWSWPVAELRLLTRAAEVQTCG